MKVLLSTLGLDVHNRGVLLVARMLKNAGMKVNYIGNAMPMRILQQALENKPDVVGISSLAGSHLELGAALIGLMRWAGIKDQIVLAIGGVFSDEDANKLQEMGFDMVCNSGSKAFQIVGGIESSVSTKQTNFEGQRISQAG